MPEALGRAVAARCPGAFARPQSIVRQRVFAGETAMRRRGVSGRPKSRLITLLAKTHSNPRTFVYDVVREITGTTEWFEQKDRVRGAGN